MRERALRMVLEGAGQLESPWAAKVSISSRIGYTPQTLNEWVKKVEIDTGQRGGVTTEHVEKNEPLSAIVPKTIARALEREVRELKRANEDGR